MKSKFALRSFLLLAGSSLLAASSLHAASTWNAGTAVSTDVLWSTATNWSADTAPADGADLIFDGAANQTNSNNIPLTSIGSLALSNAGWNITLGTSTLNNGITAAGNATLGGTLTLGAPQSWSNSTGLLTITGTVANGANLLTVGGAGNTTVSAILGNGAGGLTKNDSGTLTLTGANTFSGQLTVQNGNLVAFAVNNVSSDGRLGNSALPVILGNTGTQTGVLQYTGTTATSTKPFTMAAGGIGAFNITTAANTLTLSGVIDGGGALSKTGPGTLTLTNGSNTYSGGTVIKSGTLAISADARLGNSAGGITFDGTTTSLSLSGAITSARPITLSSGTATINMTVAASHTFSAKVTGSGAVAFTQTGGAGAHNYTLSALNNDFTGAISIDSGGAGQSATLTVNSMVDSVGAGNISISSNAGGNSAGSSTSFIYGSGATSALLLDDRRINLIGNGANSNSTGAIFSNANTTHAITVATDLLVSGANGKMTLDAAAGPINVFSGKITNSGSGGGGVIINKSGAGTWILSGANTYTGATTINGGTLVGIGANAFGSTSGISTVNTPILSLRGDSSTSFVKASDSTPYTLTTSTTGVTLNVDQATVAGTAAKTMTFGNLGTSSTAGTYQLNFTGANNTSLSAGTLNTPISTIAAVHTINNSITGGGSLTLASVFNRATLVASPDLAFAGTGNTIVTGAITQTLADMDLIKNGAGTLLLNGTNTYTGLTSVNAGTLGGIGTIAGNVTVAAAGSLAPGASANGVLNIGGGLTVTAMATGTGKLKFELGADTATSDQLAVTGTLTTAGLLGFSDFTFTNLPGGPQNGTYILITTGAPPIGTLDGTDLTGPVGSGTGTLSVSGNNIVLNVSGIGGGGNLYATWSGGAPFDADANSDGVKNGMAWVLGALDKDANAVGLLPTLDNTTDPDFFIFTYRREDDANTDAATTIKAEYGSTLTGWTPAVAGVDIIITPTDDGAGVGIDSVQVKIRRTLAVGGKLFARLNATKAP